MKRIIFSHESDIDGMGGVILSKIAFDDISYELFPNTDELELKVREYISNKELDKYDFIYITDLSLQRPAIDLVNESNLKSKIRIFDHHQKAIDEGLDKYNFSTVIEYKDNKKTCGTELFYDYLVENGYISKNDTLDEFIELTRLEDTWGWREKGEFGVKAHDLAILFNKIGKEEYIENIIKKINKNTLEFDESDKKNIQAKKDEFNKKVSEYIDSILYLCDDNNDKFGIVYAPYEYRNEITDRIITTGNKNDISYMIVVAFDKGNYGQKSYRKVKDNYDVNEIASRYGGGGHPGAAGVYITKEQKEKALKLSTNEGLEYLSKCSSEK